MAVQFPDATHSSIDRNRRRTTFTKRCIEQTDWRQQPIRLPWDSSCPPSSVTAFRRWRRDDMDNSILLYGLSHVGASCMYSMPSLSTSGSGVFYIFFVHFSPTCRVDPARSSGSSCSAVQWNRKEERKRGSELLRKEGLRSGHSV